MLLWFGIWLLIFTLVMIVALNLLGGECQHVLKKLTLTSTSFFLLICVTVWLTFDKTIVGYQFISLGSIRLQLLQPFTHNFGFGVDGVSLPFVLLTSVLIPLCLLTTWKKNFKLIADYCFFFILLEIFLILSFMALDMLSFFMFFEGILIPMFFIIGVWGSRERRVRAAYLFFFYTLFGSIFFLFVLLSLHYETGTMSFSLLSKIYISYSKQVVLWPCLFFSFAVKVPLLPVHTWLPEAHVEAPTSGSVILAGLLLKLGGYGFLRVLLPVFTESTTFYSPVVDTLALVGIIYASLTTIRQVDLKRIIAYSSVAHMNLVVLGLFSENIQGLSGALLLMVGHGIVSSGLFFLVGVLYDNYGTKLLCYYGGLVQTMPLFSTQLLILCLANTGIPGTCNFIGELIVFIGLIDKNFFIALVSVTGVVFSVLYSIFFFNRLVFGNLNHYITVYSDVTCRELLTINPLVALTFLFGLAPNLILDLVVPSVSLLVEKIKYF